jgi:hypothetical protein
MTAQIEGIEENDFTDLIRHLFCRGSSANLIILGRRESGKTDLMLSIFEICFKLKLIEHFATNAFIIDSPFPIKQITNLDDLRDWSANTKGWKLFGFDEIGKAGRRRTPMSSLNIKLLDDFQILRKYKLSIVSTTIDETLVDRAMLREQILDGVFRKVVFKNPKIAQYVDLLEKFDDTFIDIPRTLIHFDQWGTAPFSEHSPEVKPKFSDKKLQVIYDWAVHDKTAKDLGLQRVQISRIVKQFLKDILESGRYKDLLKVREADNLQKLESV